LRAKDKYAVIKWVARITGVIIAFFTLFIAIGEAIGSYNQNRGNAPEPVNILQVITFALWVACLAGYIWSWWDELKGSIFSILCATVFFILTGVNPEAHFSYILFIYLIPPIFFIIHWLLPRKPVAR
jgi:hypothetical protein